MGIDVGGSTAIVSLLVVIVKALVVGEGLKAAGGEREATTTEGGLIKPETADRGDVESEFEGERRGGGTSNGKREGDDRRIYVHY